MRHAPSTLRRSEVGIGVVELVVVLLIAVILGSLGIMSLRAARTSGGKLEIAAAARAYADAIDRYQADNGRTVPTIAASSTTWPTGSVVSGPRTAVDVAGGTTRRYYLRKPYPEIMLRSGPNRGRIVAHPTAAAAKGGTLVYRRVGTHQFTIMAYWNGTHVCTTGDIAPGSDNEC